MERIQNILQRLQELYYSKHAKSAIDLDLMLDYTRVLYADLLEWKKNVPAIADEVVTAPHKEDEQPDVEEKEAEKSDANAERSNADDEADKEVATEENSDEESAADDNEDSQDAVAEAPVAKEENTETEPLAKTQPEVADEEKETVQEEQEVETPIATHANEETSVEEKEQKEIKHEDIYSDIVEEFPEQESLNAIKDDNGISFELPSEAASISYTEDVTAVEEPVENPTVEVYELPVPDIEEAPKPQQDLFSAANSGSKKDIRAGIGINDKYLFLNELFNNHKSEYEEALDRLNRFNGYEEAYNWVIANTAVYNKWEEDDETVQNFYAVLKKHFSASK